MDRLKHALEEALKRNDDETIRWQKYQEENRQAVDNLKTFAKKLEVDVMVPIGNKAFMPGRLYHTSEIFVSHYRGYFSQLSSMQAQELLSHRIEMSKKRLSELEKEREMYQNKLEVPYADGVLPTEGERDIIEEVSEEEYKRQQEEHRKNVREYHQKKKSDKKEKSEEESHDDYMSRLEELELLEELEDELEKLDIDNDEKLQKLLSGEIQLPTEKKRISRATESNDDQKPENAAENDNSQEKSQNSEENIESLNSKDIIESIEVDTKLMNEVMAVLQASNKVDVPEDPQIKTTTLTSSNKVPEVVSETAKYEENSKASSKTKDEVQNVLRSPNNCQNKNSNSPVIKESTPAKVSPNSSLTQVDDDDDRHPDVIKMEAEIVTLTSQEKLEYFRNRLRIYEEKVIIVQTVEDLERKCTQLEIVDYIKDAIEMLKHTIYEEQKASKKSIENKKRISFAAEDEVHFIDSNAAVSSVNKKKNVIEKITFEKVEEPVILKEEDKKKIILEKVEKNLQFVAETQSQNDFDLVGKIIGTQEQESKTLYLHFEHSSNRFINPGYTIDTASNKDETIGSPSDIYKLFPQYFSTSSFDFPIITSPTSCESNNNVDKADIELNIKNNEATTSVQNNDQININVEATKPAVDDEKSKEDDTTQAKSILKNKELVNQEKHLPIPSEEDKENNQRKSKGKKKPQATFKPIMGEVVERPIEEPEPLPPGKLIDAHAPKRRISRFKQARQNP